MSTGSPGLVVDNAYEQSHIGDPFNSIIDRFLDTTGDGSGTTAMNTVADEFIIAPAAKYAYVIDELKILVGDTAGAFSITGFGNGAALTNGFKLEFRRGDDVLKTLFSAIKTNAELAALGKENFSLSDTFLSVTIKWAAPLRIPYGYSLVLETLDDMTTTEYMKARVKGRSFRLNP